MARQHPHPGGIVGPAFPRPVAASAGQHDAAAGAVMADWTSAEDAHLLPYLELTFPKEAWKRITAATGRTAEAVRRRLVILRRRYRAGLPLENSKRERKPDTRGLQYKRDVPPARIIRRKCCLCRVEFTQDRARSNFFRCELHRYANDASWLGEGGTGGRVRHVR